ncbi:MAG: hypothetical protein CVU28_07965 [Betaproteobacteria bacterium HGW-Betaproteobacteria-21]|nr:MAG: hypothetical protein CVU28_07965 [Betaproteobacteria bacterium HGW-Betaproteobacteria-21]
MSGGFDFVISGLTMVTLPMLRLQECCECFDLEVKVGRTMIASRAMTPDHCVAMLARPGVLHGSARGMAR